MGRWRLVILVPFVLVAGLGVRAAAGAAGVGREIGALRGEAFDSGYLVGVVDGPGSFGAGGRSGCAEVEISTDDSGSTGCVSVGGASAGLAQYGFVCDRGGRFLYGLVSAGAVSVRGVEGIGRVVVGRVGSLPPRWRFKARAWLVALPRARSLRSIDAVDGHGAVLATYRFASAELRCRSPIAVVRGRAHRNVNWKLMLAKTRGAGATPNICNALDVTVTTRPFAEENVQASCTPVGLAGHGLLIEPGGDHSCSPSYAIFTGLLSRRVASVEVVLKHGRHLNGRVIPIGRSAHLPFNAFVAATANNDDELAYVLHTADGRSHRFPVPQVPPPPAC